MATKQTGRPPELTQAVAELIIDDVYRNSPLAAAAAKAGFSESVAYEWVKVGGAKRWEAEGRTPSPHELAQQAFSESYVRARGTLEGVMAESVLAAGLQPSIERRTTTEKIYDNAGTEIGEKVTTVEREIPPDVANLRWALARRFHKNWSEKSQVEVGGIDGAPIPYEITIANVLGKVRALRDPDSIDAEAREIPAAEG